MISKKINNLESFYAAIEPSLKFAGVNVKKKWLPFVIKMCRLKPQSFVMSKSFTIPKRARLFTRWIDEYGNCLKLEKTHRQKLSISYNNSLINPKQLVITDLYACLPLDKVAKMSKLLYFRAASDSNGQPRMVLAFLGIDNFLRTFNLIDGVWMSAAPLELGCYVLEQMAIKAEMQNNYTKVLINKLPNWPCTNQVAWLSSWYPSSEFLSILTQYPQVVDILNIGK